VVVNGDGRIVVYMGDDDYFEYVYRFVSADAYDPAKPGAARDILDRGGDQIAAIRRRNRGGARKTQGSRAQRSGAQARIPGRR